MTSWRWWSRESKAQALDAAEAVIIDYDPLPAVADMEAALEADAPILHEAQGSNVANAMGTGPVDGILDDADVVVSQRIVNQRLAAVPMEPNGIVAIPGDPIDGMTLWVSSQGPFAVRDAVAGTLGLDPNLVRARCAAVGGGFGPKQGVYVEFLLTAKAARVLDRPVKWAEGRSENMLSMAHGRAQVHYAELGVKRDGTITGLRVRTVGDAGAYPGVGAFLPFFTQMMSQAVYRTPKIEFNWQAVATNTTPTAAYRGAGRPEATHLVERMLDIAADELDMDPAEIRRRNFIPPDAFPYTTITGATYDIGDYEKPLAAVLAASGYDELRAEQAARRERDDPKLLGIGVSAYVEITAPVGLHREWGKVEIDADGTVLGYVGTSAHGQGHETAFSMILSETLGVPFEQIRILQSDTAVIARGRDRWISFTPDRGSALKVAGDEVLVQAKQLAAHLFEANPDDVVLGDGGLQVVGVPARRSRGPTSRRPRRTTRAGPKGWRRVSRTNSTSTPARRRSRSAPTLPSSRSTAKPAASNSCATSRSTTAVVSSTRCSLPASNTAASRKVRRRFCTSTCSTTKTRTRSPRTSWTTRCRRPRSSRRTRCRTPRRRARSTRLVRRGSANRRRSVRRRPCTMR